MKFPQKEDIMGTTKKHKFRSIEGFTTLDDFLAIEGTRETFQAVAIKEVLTLQIGEVMNLQGLSP